MQKYTILYDNKFLTESPMQRMLKWVELLAELAFEVLDPE